MNLLRIDAANRGRVNRFLEEHWFTTKMVVRGKGIDMTEKEGFFFEEEAEIVGLITYETEDGVLEILSLDSLREGCGIGSELVRLVVDEAKRRGCKKVVLITTNDNVNAIRFYQKRGFDMARLYRNALEQARRLKPEIPLIGDDGIPLRHEIEFEMIL